jgi:hypothetical protein
MNLLDLKNTAVVYQISKEYVLSQNIKPIEKLILSMLKYKDQVRGNLILQFDGYDSVPDEIYEIPEIRSYVSKVVQRFPYIFYYLSQLDNLHAQWLACLGDVEVVYIGELCKSPEEYRRINITADELPQKGMHITLPAPLKEKITRQLTLVGRQFKDMENINPLVSWIRDFDEKSA